MKQCSQGLYSTVIKELSHKEKMKKRGTYMNLVESWGRHNLKREDERCDNVEEDQANQVSACKEVTGYSIRDFFSEASLTMKVQVLHHQYYTQTVCLQTYEHEHW